jgi:micrococcal nuclease
MALPLIAAAVVAVGAVGGGAVVAVNAMEGDTARVVRVIDGDTFDASIEGVVQRVRLLNVDTPETKDPDEAVQCLGPEASQYLTTLLAEGDTVTLTYDEERYDRYGRLLAGVDKDDLFVNAEIARQGLGVAVQYPPNDRYYDEVLEAQQEAETQQAGLYSETVTCTLPARVAGVERSVAAGSPTTPEAMDGEAARLAGSAGLAGAVLGWFDLPHGGPSWTAFTDGQRQAFRDRITAAGTSLRSTAASWTDRASAARAQIEAARVAEENRVKAEAESRARAEADARRAEAAAREEQRRVAAAERAEQRRIDAAAAAERKASSSSPSSGSSSSGSSSGGGGAYPGYTGPRCYAPGGKTWRPC